MYKDLDKKRATDRERQRRHRSGVVTPCHAFVDGMGKWAKLRGGSVTPSVTPMAKEFVVDDKPVPAWRVEKDRQMAEFLKRYGK